MLFLTKLYATHIGLASPFYNKKVPLLPMTPFASTVYYDRLSLFSIRYLQMKK